MALYQVLSADSWDDFHGLIRPDLVTGMNDVFHEAV